MEKYVEVVEKEVVKNRKKKKQKEARDEKLFEKAMVQSQVDTKKFEEFAEHATNEGNIRNIIQELKSQKIDIRDLTTEEVEIIANQLMAKSGKSGNPSDLKATIQILNSLKSQDVDLSKLKVSEFDQKAIKSLVKKVQKSTKQEIQA